MEEASTEITVIRVWRRNDYGDRWSYVRSARYTNEVTYSDDPKLGLAVDLNDPTEVVKLYDTIQKSLKPGEKMEVVTVKITTVIEPVNMNQGEILEERRRRALAKLTTDDIDALGISQIASYNKLKYHPVQKG